MRFNVPMLSLKGGTKNYVRRQKYLQGRRRRGGQGGARASPLSKVGGTSGFMPPPPTFGQSKCSNFTICSYFVVKNTIFSKFSLRSPTLINQYFLNFANLKL